MTITTKGLSIYLIDNNIETKAAESNLISSIALAMMLNYPRHKGIELLLFKDNIPQQTIYNEYTDEQICERWVNALPKFAQDNINTWLIDLYNIVLEKKSELELSGNISSFSLGDLSKSFNGPTGGVYNWNKILPSTNIALFKAIGINFRKKLMTVRWLR